MKKANRVGAWVVLTGMVMGAVAMGCGGGNGAAKPDGSDARMDADVGGGDRTDAIDAVDTGPPPVVRLMASPSPVALTEGSPTNSMSTFTVSLDKPWATPITVALMSANPNVATVVPETLEFNANDATPKTVMVFAALDDDTMDNTTTISLFSTETGTTTVTVNVDDVDVQALLATPPRLAMTEGRSETLNVRLAKKPSSAVVVTVASSSTAKLATSPATLTFNAGNYSIPQQIALMAAQDDDAMLDNVTVNLTATGNIQALPVPVEITDDDAVNLDVTPPSLTLVERANMPGTISVKLTRPPTSDVTVTVASSNAKATVSPATLTFTAANSATAQTVQVSAASDDDARDETATITFTAAGVTPTPPPRTVAVTIDDPDNQAIQVTPSMVSVGEGNSTTFDVRLLLNPGASVTVNVFSQNPGKIEVLPPALIFNATTFGTAQQVTVRSLQDDDLANDMVNVTLLSSGADNVNVPVSITDDDQQRIELIPAVAGATLVMQETQVGGTPSTSPLGVRLAKRPAGPLTVNLATSSTKLTRSPASLTFTPSDYTTPQFVTLTAPNDGDLVDDMATVTASATGVDPATLDVQILDVDVQNFIIQPQTLGVINEGASKTFAVMLTIVPPTAVTVNFVSSNSSKVSVSSQQCALTATNYNSPTACAITVTAEQDLDVRDETATITVTDAGGAITTRTLSVAVDDDDVQALLVSPFVPNAPLPFREGGSGSFTVALAFNPIDAVTVSVFSLDPARIGVSSPSLTFNSMTPQTVNVTSLHDDDLANETVTIRIAGQAAGVAAPVDLMLAIPDDDTQVIQVTPASSQILEGAAVQIGVRLQFRPATSQMVTLGKGNPNAMMPDTGSTDDLGVSPTMLTFTPENYSTNQFVTLSAVDDVLIEGGIPEVVTVTATGAGAPAPTLHPVSIVDNDTLSFDVSPTSLGTVVEEGTTTSFIVKLTATPTNPVIPVLSTNSASVTASFASPCTLTTMLSSCSVTVTAVTDQNALDEDVTITVADNAGAMGPMRPIASRTVTVTTDDNDTQAIVLENVANPIVVPESPSGGSQSFIVKLAFNPVNSQSITLAPSSAGVITISPTSCVLTSANYNMSNCTITLGGLEDLDLIDQFLSIQVSAPGLGVSDAFVNVRKPDNDMQQLVLRTPPCGTVVLPRDPNTGPLADNALTIASINEEGAGETICVSLGYEPDQPNTVTLTPSSGKLGAAPGMLMFGKFDYFTSKPVAVTGIADADTLDVAGATLTVSVVPLAPQKTVTVTTIADNDRSLTVVPAVGGSVSSSPAGIMSCTTTSGAGTCDETYTALFLSPPPATLAVTLTPTPDVTPSPGWAFGGWSGTGCGGTVTMSADRICTPAFAPNLSLTVTSGMGTMGATGTGGAISSCSTTCTDDFTLDASVTLTRTPASGWAVGPWTGTGCSTGTVSMSVPRSCSTNFVPLLSVSITGSGTVTSSGGSGSISACSTSCSDAFTLNDMVTLTPTPASGWMFDAWTGTGCTTGTVTMSAARNCTATFSLTPG